MRTNTSRFGTLGLLWMIYGILCVAKAAWIVINGATLTLMWGALLNRVANPFFWMSMFHFAMLAVVILAVVTALISFLAAIALMQAGASSRTLALVASFLGLITGPLGIALGVYTMIVMLPQTVGQSRADFVSAA
jgi:fumarate reductase subunit D